MDEANPTVVEDSEIASDSDTVEVTSEDEQQPQAPLILPEDLDARVEAALMTSERPMTAGRVAEALGVAGAGRAVEECIEALNEQYERTGRSFRIEKVAGAWQVVTLAKYADVLDGLKRGKQDTGRLSASQLETLAIVAYKQPITRAEIDAIRGVGSGQIIRTLMDKKMVRVVGRVDLPGRPFQYGTTRQFLEQFALNSLDDLPKGRDL